MPSYFSITKENPFYSAPVVHIEEQVSGSATMTFKDERFKGCLLYTSPSPRDVEESRMPSSA